MERMPSRFSSASVEMRCAHVCLRETRHMLRTHRARTPQPLPHGLGDAPALGSVEEDVEDECL
eukprot:4215442-Prymnesium_polylepis.1